MATSLYIHIPFCAAKCVYCSFNSHAGMERLHERYVDALCLEMEQSVPHGHVDPLETLFLGGGTPTLLSPHLLEKVLATCRNCFPHGAQPEISIEANPGTVNREKLSILRACGVNRLSIGVQSFDDQELKRLGRIHSAGEAVEAVEMAREVGFSNISLDLMYGLPGQDPESWRASLEKGLQLAPQHLSLYQLTLEEGTPLARMVARGEQSLADDEGVAAMDEITAELTRGAGLAQYEISNYASQGGQCCHNVNYWKNGEYFGFGAGAVSYRRGHRLRNGGDPEEYCTLLEAGRSVVVEEESLDQEASFRETVIMGLRMNLGLSLQVLHERYGMEPVAYYGDVLRSLLDRELLEERGGFLRLTEQGRRFANLVMAELV
ncbi:MAG: radical SAM family heme chaperone HemW [Thermodesulfobacteriota bacterium]